MYPLEAHFLPETNNECPLIPTSLRILNRHWAASSARANSTPILETWANASSDRMFVLTYLEIERGERLTSTRIDHCYLPWRDNVNPTPIKASRPSQRVHNPPHSPFTRTVLRSPRNVQKRRPGAYQNQTSILLFRRWLSAILSNEVVYG